MLMAWKYVGSGKVLLLARKDDFTAFPTTSRQQCKVRLEPHGVTHLGGRCRRRLLGQTDPPLRTHWQMMDGSRPNSQKERYAKFGSWNASAQASLR